MALPRSFTAAVSIQVAYLGYEAWPCPGRKDVSTRRARTWTMIEIPPAALPR